MTRSQAVIAGRQLNGGLSFIGVRAFTASGLEFYLISHINALLYTFRDIGVNECRCFPGSPYSVTLSISSIF